jgi:hypothetical protein
MTVLSWVVMLAACVVLAVWYMRTGAEPEPASPDEAVTERIPKYAERRPKLLVVSGDYRQFEVHCAENGINRLCDAVYVAGPHVVRGHYGAKFVMTGAYMKRPDLVEILAELAAADCTKM